MVLSIKNPEADRLARELARRRNRSITSVVIEALRSGLARETSAERRPGVAERLMAIGARYAALPKLDDRADEAILGYEEMTRRR